MTVQVLAEVVSQPSQPVNVAPVTGVAVSVTVEPLENDAEHVNPHEMPAGELVTVAPIAVTSSGCRLAVNVAVTDWAAVIVTAHVPRPVQAPDQPANVEPGAGVAVSVTAVPNEKVAKQVAPQSMGGGVELTLPKPLPAFATDRPNDWSVNTAPTLFAASIVTLQSPVPEQAPVQPLKLEPALGEAESDTIVPAVKGALQAAPQKMPAGVEVTVPLPSASFTTSRSNVAGENVAVTVCAALIVRVHAPVPVHAPDQPANVEDASGVAVSVTRVPDENELLQAAPQKIASGDEVTVPLPAPARFTVSVYVTSVNVAVTFLAASIVTTQAPVPVHAPLQPANDELASGVALSVTSVPSAKPAAQAGPQEMPAGEEVTVPEPVPARATVSVRSSAKVACTVWAALIVTVQPAVPVQAPLQPTNTAPGSGDAVRSTTVPGE